MLSLPGKLQMLSVPVVEHCSVAHVGELADLEALCAHREALTAHV